MATLTVWIAEQSDDSSAYNIVAPTKKEALRQIEERSHMTFDPPVKVTIYYRNAFDLFDRATGENGGRHTFWN